MARSRTKNSLEEIREHFDAAIINTYIHDIQSQFGLSNDRLWGDVAEKLVISKSTQRRRILRVGRHGTTEDASPDPRLIDLFRYLAATGHVVTLPRGRDVVLRSLASTLTHIRSRLPGYAERRSKPGRSK